MKSSLFRRQFDSFYLNFDSIAPMLGIYSTEKLTEVGRDYMQKDNHAELVVIQNIKNKKMSINRVKLWLNRYKHCTQSL